MSLFIKKLCLSADPEKKLVWDFIENSFMYFDENTKIALRCQDAVWGLFQLMARDSNLMGMAPYRWI